MSDFACPKGHVVSLPGRVSASMIELERVCPTCRSEREAAPYATAVAWTDDERWFLTDGDEHAWAIVSTQDRAICGLFGNAGDLGSNEPDDIDKMHAALIIAAPKMIEVLPRVLATMQEAEVVLLELAQYSSDEEHQNMASNMAQRLTDVLAAAHEFFTALPEAGL